MITGKTKLIGILGWPVEHSLSPLMHNAAFIAAELDYIYIPLPVKPEDLGEAIKGLRVMGFFGANVTIPHKVAVMQYLDKIDYSAQLVGAVNTIVIRNGRCIGYNTDAEGFVQSLQTKNVTIAGKRAVLLGAGGAARAVACGLIEHGIKTVIVGTRNKDKAQDFVALFPQRDKLTGCCWEEKLFTSALQECDLLINTTPIGMSPNIGQEPPLDWCQVNAAAVVCDLIYNPRQTQFLSKAAKFGHSVINGEGMLVEQGALAFNLWTGEWPSRQMMYKVFMD